MTSQQIADQSLSIYQAHRAESRAVVSSLLDQFFDRITADEYDRILSRVPECMSCPEITGSQSQSHSPAHS